MTDPFYITSPLVGSFGGINFPLNPNDYDSSLVPLDPARSLLTALFKSAINAELGSIWDKINIAPSALSNTVPVEMTLEIEPSAHHMRQLGARYPLLALHRSGEQTWSEFTMQVEKCEQEWQLHYILPALEIGDYRRFSDVFRIIPEIVRRVIRLRGHQSYDDGRLQFFPDRGGIGSIKLTKAESGQSKFGGGEDSPIWNAVTMTLMITEYGNDTEEEFGTFEGIDYKIGVGDVTGIIPDMIEASTDVLGD